MDERGSELVDDDVAGLGLVRIGDRQLGLVRRLGIDHLDVDPRGETAGGEQVPQTTGMTPDRVAAVQHGYELVHPAHGRVDSERHTTTLVPAWFGRPLRS